MSFKKTVNWLFNDIWCYLVIDSFDWKIRVFQLTVAEVYYIINRFEGDHACKSNLTEIVDHLSPLETNNVKIPLQICNAKLLNLLIGYLKNLQTLSLIALRTITTGISITEGLIIFINVLILLIYLNCFFLDKAKKSPFLTQFSILL